MGFGPFSWYFGGSRTGPPDTHSGETEVPEPSLLRPYEEAAIKALRSDQQFVERLRRYGVPWRGVQERLKEELPDVLSDRDKIAYGLLPKAMDAVFGPQQKGWKTEKRPSKTGRGHTTWILAIETGV
jgi:hypothetical protein